MNEMITRLLDLDALRLGQEGVHFALARPLPAWAWAAVGVAALAWSGMTYARVSGRRPVRAVLAGLRAVLLVMIVILVCGPQLVHRQEEIDKDWVVVLVDRSASMSINDAPGRDGQRETRDAQLRAALAGQAELWNEFANQRTLMWQGFDRGAFDLPTDTNHIARLEEPIGRRTALGAALDQSLSRAAARPVAGVIVLSDGRTWDAPSRATMRRLASERIPIFVVPLGSPEAVSDIQVTQVDAPRVSYAADFAPVVVELERIGQGAAGVSGATVRLVDRSTGIVLDEQRVELDGAASGETGEASASVALTVRPERAGAQQWRVEVVPDGDDLLSTNNTSDLQVEIVDRPMRVLFIDGYPRWEQRYLRNLLLREGSVNASTLILAPDRRYLQEGDTELDRLPISPEEWAEYDAIILGDVSPEVFTLDQLEQIREHVALRGGGLLWAGGPGATPRLWFDTPLAELLPFTKGAADGTPVLSAVVMAPTPDAERMGVLRLGDPEDPSWPEVLSDASAAWPLLRYAQAMDVGALKPAVQVLAMGEPVMGGESTPLVLAMRFGAGRSLYVATDEIWRWRYGRGELYFERFWLQMLRMLGRERLARSGASAVLVATPRRATVDQPVRISLELVDQRLIDLDLASVTVRAQRDPQPGELEPEIIEIALDRSTDALAEARGVSPDSADYAATWIPSTPGRWSIRPDEADLVGVDVSAEVEVILPDDELRHPEADHEALAELASRSGGAVVAADDLGRLRELLPNRERRRVLERSETLWDTPLALLMLIGLLTSEWVGRRLIRLA